MATDGSSEDYRQDIREALSHYGEISGDITGEEVLKGTENYLPNQKITYQISCLMALKCIKISLYL